MRIGIFFVITTGSLAHFFYDWSGHASIVGYFTPVNESIWEHMKLLFFPMLLYAFVLTVRLRHHAPSIPSALCTGILLGTFLIPLFFYSYTLVLGKAFLVLDISTFLVSILIAFWLSYRLASSVRILRYTHCFTALLGFCSCYLYYLRIILLRRKFLRTLQFDVGQNVNIANFSKIPQIS